MVSLKLQKAKCKNQNCGIRLRRMTDSIGFFVLWNILFNKQLRQI